MKPLELKGFQKKVITRYREYLKFLDKELEKMFEAQTPFIKCHKGCSYCCKEGEFPLSELEYIYLMLYYNELDDNIKDKINENITALLEKSREKIYECPFLVDNICMVYPARAIICRTFGLISYDSKGKKRMPFCVDLDLNYSDVFDKQTRTIKKYADNGTEPLAYNIDRKFLRSNKIQKEFNIFFGEDKPLVEWLAEENFNI